MRLEKRLPEKIDEHRWLINKEHPPTHDWINSLSVDDLDAVIARAADDFMTFLTFFVFTNDTNPVGEYPDWKLQKPLPFWRPYFPIVIARMLNCRRLVFWKSRRMQATWLETAKNLQKLLFHQPSNFDVFALDERKGWLNFIVGRYKQALDNIPQAFKERRPDLFMEKEAYRTVKTDRVVEFSNGNLLSLVNTSMVTGRGGDINGLHWEEACFSEVGDSVLSVYGPMIGSGGDIHIISTPNEEDYIFNVMVGQYDRSLMDREWMSQPEGHQWVWEGESNPKDEEISYHILLLHNNAWPERHEAGKLFQQETAPIRDRSEIEREYLLNFAVAKGKPVYSMFTEGRHVLRKPPKVDEDKPIFVGFDDGITYKGVVVAQKNEWGGIDVLGDLDPWEKDYLQLIHEMDTLMGKNYGVEVDWKNNSIWYNDPQGQKRVMGAHRPPNEILQETTGVRAYALDKSNRLERAKDINHLFRQNIQGQKDGQEIERPLVRISPIAQGLIKDLKFRYKFKQTLGRPNLNEPADKTNPPGRIHVMDAFGFLFQGLLRYREIRAGGARQPATTNQPSVVTLGKW